MGNCELRLETRKGGNWKPEKRNGRQFPFSTFLFLGFLLEPGVGYDSERLMDQVKGLVEICGVSAE